MKNNVRMTREEAKAIIREVYQFSDDIEFYPEISLVVYNTETYEEWSEDEIAPAALEAYLTLIRLDIEDSQ